MLSEFIHQVDLYLAMGGMQDPACVCPFNPRCAEAAHQPVCFAAVILNHRSQDSEEVHLCSKRGRYLK